MALPWHSNLLLLFRGFIFISCNCSWNVWIFCWRVAECFFFNRKGIFITSAINFPREFLSFFFSFSFLHGEWILFSTLIWFAGMYQIREANQMVEEFMLAANVSVAEQILKSFPLCSLLRLVADVPFWHIGFMCVYFLFFFFSFKDGARGVN